MPSLLSASLIGECSCSWFSSSQIASLTATISPTTSPRANSASEEVEWEDSAIPDKDECWKWVRMLVSWGCSNDCTCEESFAAMSLLCVGESLLNEGERWSSWARIIVKRESKRWLNKVERSVNLAVRDERDGNVEMDWDEETVLASSTSESKITTCKQLQPCQTDALSPSY